MCWFKFEISLRCDEHTCIGLVISTSGIKGKCGFSIRSLDKYSLSTGIRGFGQVTYGHR